MNDIIATQPKMSASKATIQYDFSLTDEWLDSLEKCYKPMIVDYDNKEERKEAKEICAQFRKCKKALQDEAKRKIEEASVNIKEFETELKKRLERLEAIREPLYDQVKPQKKPEPKKVKVITKVCYQFVGDSEYISNMIGAAMFNDIEVTEVKL